MDSTCCWRLFNLLVGAVVHPLLPQPLGRPLQKQDGHVLRQVILTLLYAWNVGVHACVCVHVYNCARISIVKQ